MGSSETRVEVRRMVDLDEWELYRLVDSDTGEVLSKVGLRVGAEAMEVEYGFWALDDADPSRTGKLPLDLGGRTWSDADREAVVREVVRRYGKDVAIKPKELAFHLGAAS